MIYHIALLTLLFSMAGKTEAANSVDATIRALFDEKYQAFQNNITDLVNMALKDYLNAKYEALKDCPICMKMLSGDWDCRNRHPKDDCLAFYEDGARRNGLYQINGNKDVFCDLEGGGWTVIQRRVDGSENFNRNWADYKNGFGDLKKEFYLGNENIHKLTEASIHPKSTTLLINMKFKNVVKPVYAMYNNFGIGDEKTMYKLKISAFTGNTTDEMAYHNGCGFSTYDKDPVSSNCASTWKGGWWFKGCYNAYLNGLYAFTGSNWRENHWTDQQPYQQPTFVEMKVKRNV